MKVTTTKLSAKALAPLAMFIALVIMLAYGLTRDPSVLPTEMVNRPFPDFAMTTLADPDVIVREDIIQGQITLVNVFGSWCTACVYEHPKLMDIAASKRVRLMGIDWRDTRPKGQAWLNKYGNPYDIVLFDSTSQLAIDLGITGAPETYLVDQAGQIRYKHIGIITDEVWKQTLLPMIQSLEES